MATLVLTVVGGIVGGPVGASIGAIIGQEIDRDIIFKPKGRQGPRLTSLAVQTSSYGTAIPKVYGTMRVAGTVIWSTELIESRSKSSQGKGQPSLTTYSYSVSFAVALSGRGIAGVGRIWADGKLLRGVGGDFKTATGFRLHAGGEAQDADPLIAAAEGGMAPAHRGVAYAVFENFQLAEYGNRIPSLTFEVTGDDGAVSAGGIAADLSGGLIDGSGATLPLAGFAASGDSVRGAVEVLAEAAGAWFSPVGGGVAMTSAGVSVAIGDDGVAAEGDPPGGRRRTVAAIETVPRALSVVHYDPARDYQTGMQRAERPGPGAREERVEIAAALPAEVAKAVAEARLARMEAERERRSVALGWSALALAPGACVTIAGESGRWRVAGWSLEHMVLTLDCVRLARGTAVTAAASAGRVLSAPDLVAGTTILHAFELPPLDDTLLSAPRLTIAAAGTGAGWRRAALLMSLDDGAHWTPLGGSAAPATLGTVAVAPGTGPSTIEDRVASLEVVLAHDAMALANADAAALDAGANLALVGNELLQFGVAEQIAPARWRLSRLWRGRRGSEAAIGTQMPVDRFVLLDSDTLTGADLPLSAVGTIASVMASGIGDAEPVVTSAAVRGVSVLPPSPVHPRVSEAGGGDAAVDWVRRSRVGWRWIDGADAPLGEEREAYRVTVTPASGAARTLETADPVTALSVAERAAGPVTLSIRQAGSNGESAAVIVTVSE